MEIKKYEAVIRSAGASVCRENEPMSAHTTFRAGGPADLFIEPANAEELAGMLAVCRRDDIPFLILGRGSNVLCGDGGYRGIIFHLGDNLADVKVEGTKIEAQAGITLASLARAAKEASLTGLEFAAGIPGTLGGALVMDAGAYGGEMKDVVTEVLILDEQGNQRWITADEMDLGYRHSILMEKPWIALGARMELKPGDPETIAATMSDLAERRRSKQPLEYPSAGSTFKRPAGYFAGKLIQDAGLAEYTVGGACVSGKHCGFVINRDHATAADIMAVCRHVETAVQEKYGVGLEMEVRCFGEF